MHRIAKAPWLVGLIAALTLALPAVAVDDLILNLGTGSDLVQPGDTVTVTLDVANLSAAINGVQVRLSYDTTVMTLVDVVPTTLTAVQCPAPCAGWVEVSQSDTVGDIDWAAIITDGSMPANLTVATLTFTVIDETTPDTVVIFRLDSPPFRTKLTVAADNSTILPNKLDSGLIVSMCDDGLFCNGLETFDGLVCQPGADPCDDGVGCTDDVCDDVLDACTNTPNDVNCDDGFFCTGVETCDPVADCQSGSDPCDDGVACTIDTCDEGLDSCSNLADDAFCDNTLFCDGAETCNVLLGCQTATDPCAPLVCDEATDTCFAPIHVANLEVFYAGRFGVCVGGDFDGLYCSSDAACRNGACDVSDPLADPRPKFLAAGSTGTLDNITNYVGGITGIRVLFDNIVGFATTPEAAFTFDWSMPPECVGGGRDGLICDPDNPNDQCVLQGGTCEVFFLPVADSATTISITTAVQGGVTVVSIVLDDDHVRARWLKVTIDAMQVTASGVELDGELVGNPVVLPSGDGTPGGNALFYLGNAAGDADGNRKTELNDPFVIRNCSCFIPFFRVPITEPFDVDKDVWVRLGDPGAARAVVNPFVKVPLISP